VAGLFDSLFSGNGIGGGLLDYLNSPVYQNAPPSQFQQPDMSMTPTERQMMAMVRPDVLPSFPNAIPPGGMPQQPPQQPGPPQASPIAIGNYMMPRMGPASAYQSDPANIPPNAQPTQGQAPQGQMPQMPDQAMPLPPALGGMGSNVIDRIARGLQSVGNGGGLIGALTGNYTDPQSVGQQNLKAQYDSLVPVLGPKNALLAVMNPEAGKTLIQEALTNKEKYGVISEDPLEGKKYGFINEREQTVNGKPIGQAAAGQAAAGGGLAAVREAQDRGVTGDALYEYLPASYRNTVKAMVEGRQPLPSTAAMRSPSTLAMIDAAHSIDPSFDATIWKARNEAGPDWTKGKSSEMVRSANQTLHHVNSLMNAMDDLSNGRVPAMNAVGNYFNENVRGTGEQGAFRTNAHAVAEEMSKVFKGANLSDSEIKHWEQNLSENMSPAQQKAQVAKLAELLHGSLQALEEKRVSAMGPAQAARMGPIIKDEGQRVLERVDKWVKDNGQSQPAASKSEAPKSGAYVWTPDKGLQPK
jgi:hypothetical protein